MTLEHFDVLIMGAGLSGIDAAHHLQKFCPNKSYVILEQRERIGGTWDLFRYPGIRSDSDMLTMGYSFRPWTSPKAISPGRRHPRLHHRHRARRRHRPPHPLPPSDPSAPRGPREEAKWTVEAVRKLPDGREEPVTLTCNFLFSCAGYYRYSAGYTPEFPDIDRFQGRVVHPQAWPEDLDYAGKRVVIIGSGATAVTLVPAMAKTAGHVTMLQRSPTYIVSHPEQDAIANWLRRVLPATLGLQAQPLEERRLHDVYLPALAALSEFREDRLRQEGARGVGSRLRRRHALHAALQSLGAAALPGSGCAICSRRSNRAAPA